MLVAGDTNCKIASVGFEQLIVWISIHNSCHVAAKTCRTHKQEICLSSSYLRIAP